MILTLLMMLIVIDGVEAGLKYLLKDNSYKSKYELYRPETEYIQRVEEIIDGKFGNGQDRINQLKKLGYNIYEIGYIQSKVNEFLS